MVLILQPPSFLETTFGTTNTAYIPQSADSFDPTDRLLSIGNGTGIGFESDAFTILKNGKTGVGYDNFETTAFDSLLQVNGSILSANLPSTQDDSGTFAPVNFLYTDSNGKFLSAPLASLSAIKWYAENVTAPTTAPVATGIGSIALGDESEALASSMFVYGKQAGFGATNAFNSNFIGAGAGYDATFAAYSNFFGLQAGSGAAFADYSNFIGYQSGNNATNANVSNFIGYQSGDSATDAEYSTFIGSQAGQSAITANNSIFIGNGAGIADTVDNSLNGTSILIGDDTSTGGFSNSIALGKGATNTSTNQLMIGSTTSPINTLILTGSGGNTCILDVTVASPSCSSDETLKTNITDLTSTLDILSKVKTVTYNWKNYPTKGMQIGFLAQDLEQYFPEVVTLAPNGYKTVSYGGLTPILTKAIQELNIKLTTLPDTTTPNTFRDSLIAWLGDVGNGITELFAGKVRTNELCVGNTCLNENQIQQILQYTNTNINTNTQIETVSTPTPVISDNTTETTPTIPDGSDTAPVIENIETPTM